MGRLRGRIAVRPFMWPIRKCGVPPLLSRLNTIKRRFCTPSGQRHAREKLSTGAGGVRGYFRRAFKLWIRIMHTDGRLWHESKKFI